MCAEVIRLLPLVLPLTANVAVRAAVLRDDFKMPRDFALEEL